MIGRHKILIGFNNKCFDQPILKKYEINFEYKIVLDLYEISAPKGDSGYGYYNKNKLPQMGYVLKNYNLKNICDELKLDEFGKGDIDYNIFKKDDWSDDELKEIQKYLKQDIILTKKLYEWYEEQFKPLKEMLPINEQNKLTHISASLSSLSYKIICNKAGLPIEWDDKKPKTKSFSGGHHINPRWNKAKGNIIEIDFCSAYPHALMMGNLFSPLNSCSGNEGVPSNLTRETEQSWNGKEYYQIEGTYNSREFGKVESALRDIFLERLKAKKEKDKPKNLSYKIIINSLYGLTGNYKFKSLYNPTTASDCTSIVRTWMKKLAKTLEENDFICLYGFTDSIFVQIPEESNKEELMFIVNSFIEDIKKTFPFPQDTFGIDIEEELKFIWFYAKNCYLFVTNDDKVKYKSTLLNSNTPKVVIEVFEKYMKPKIISELDVNFTKQELIIEIKKLLEKTPELSAEEWKVQNKETYKVRSSMQYQISNLYGKGMHQLIPNTKNIGAGKSSKLCSLEDFKSNNLSVEDIDLKKMSSHLKAFITKPQKNQEKIQ